MLGMGAQLELSTPLRDAMFANIRRPRRKHTTTQLFWTFVAVCRDAPSGSRPNRPRSRRRCFDALPRTV